MQRSHFETAGILVEEWLDRGSGSAWAKRDSRLPWEQGRAWNIDLSDDRLPVKAARLHLPPDFPASPCAFFVDPSHFLKLPHVEGDGKVCLGLSPIPNDYEDPVGAIVRGLQALRNLLETSANDARWVEEQFNRERASYWAQWCLKRKREPDRRPVASRTFADLRALDRWAAGEIAAYVPKGSKHRLYSLQIAAVGVDPQETAARHRWADGMVVRGSALFVRMPAEHLWTPSTWPRSFDELETLVQRLTDGASSVVEWVRGARRADRSKSSPHKKNKLAADGDAPPGQRPFLVVLVQDGQMFGYQLYGSAVPRLERPSFEPVNITRVDPDWALARDHQLDVLHARRQRRVLILGCGSLGSPLAKALARAGIGAMDIVDLELMDVENVSRHELGIDDSGVGKATALAQRLMKEVPGLVANGYLADTTTWCLKHCNPGMYDLIVECTAESSVRSFVSRVRSGLFGECPVIHAWTEPLCSAGHVVLSQVAVPWPDDDPADARVNASDLSATDTRVQLPACSGGFHPYGAADIALVAAFAAERVIAVLDDTAQESTVWSWVRASAFFDALSVPVATRAIVPVSRSRADSTTVTRSLAELLSRQ